MQNLTEIKHKLLDTGYFIENTYLEKYLQLIGNNSSERRNTIYTENHHILQFSYFTTIIGKLTKQEKQKLRHECIKQKTKAYELISNNNLVYVSFYTHYLAHYYLYNCTTGVLKYDNESAVLKMTGRDLQLRNCSEEEITKILELLEQLRADPNSNSFKSRLIDQVIIDNYSIGGYKQCLQILKDTYGIISTKQSIKSRAIKLDIRGARFTPEWTELELQILKDNYAKYGYKKCLELLPNRTKFSIQARAKYLGIVAPGASKANAAWSAEEDAILQKYYSIGGTKLCMTYLPNRTEKAIKHRANNKFFIFVDTDQITEAVPVGKNRIVYLIDNDNNILQEFKSINEASLKTGISTASISSVCNGKLSSVKNHKFCFKSKYERT